MTTTFHGDTPRPPDPEITVYATNKAFCNIYDALRIERIKIELASYDPATRHQLDRASAYLPADQARLLCHLVLTRTFAAVLPKARFERFGGSTSAAGVESRVLVLEHDPGEGGRFAGYPYRLTISAGPGEKAATGAIRPQGEPTHRVSLRFPEADLMRLCLTVQSYLAADSALHHDERVGANVSTQVSRREQRAEQRAAPPEAPREINPLPCTAEQITDITKGMDILNFDDPTRRAWLTRYRVTSVKQLSVADATALHLALQNEYKARRAQTSRVGT